MSDLERLFLFAKNLAREEVDEKLESQIDSLLEHVNSQEEKIFALKMFLLICIMKRTHVTSQAPGVAAGACGEKKQLRSALLYFSKLGYTELVCSALHVIPIYGCWSDLRVLGEELFLFYMKENPQEQVVIDKFPILAAICAVFATQLKKDHQLLQESSRVLPSTAFKYCFHFSRHDNHRVAVLRNKRKRVDEGKFNPNKHWNKKGKKPTDATKENNKQAYAKRKLMKSRAKGFTADAEETKSAPQAIRLPVAPQKSPLFVANACFSNYLASNFLFPGQSFSAQYSLQAAYRSYFKPFRERVLERKACLENFMCKQLWNKISFVHAPKGALLRMKNSLERHGQKNRMLLAMKKNSNAIPNIEDIGKCIEDLMEEFEGVAGISLELYLRTSGARAGDVSSSADDDGCVPSEILQDMMIPLVISKSIQTLISQRQQILGQAKSLLNKLNDADDNAIADFPCVPMVDTMNCTRWSEKAQLVLAGYMVAIANGVKFFIVDGKECSASLPPASVTDSNQVRADPLLWLRYIPLDLESSAVETLERMTIGLDRALESVFVASTHNASPRKEDLVNRGFVDVLFLCRDFTVDPELFSPWLTLQQSQGLRNFQIHRVRRAASNGATNPFCPRRSQYLNAEVIRSDISLDFLFVLDLTGSMQPYIDAARKYLLEIIQEVRSSTGVKDVRFAFIGYRDYCDQNNVHQPRFVVHDFTLDPQSIIQSIRNQKASGGGDHPEDLLGGLVKALDLSWRSPVRLMTIVTDAPAHGFTGSTYGDDHPSGRCPDQKSPHLSFHEAVDKLANVLAVDTLFVRCGSTEVTEQAIASVYPQNGKEGFGVLQMANGAQELKSVLCDGLSKAVNYLFGPPEQVGISIAEGNTLSALASSACLSLRESARDEVTAASVAVVPEVENMEASTAMMVVEESTDKTNEGNDDEDGDAAAVGDDLPEEEWGDAKIVKDALECKDMEERGKEEGLTDYQTLLQHLQRDFLSLARDALGLTVARIAQQGLRIIGATSDIFVEEVEEEEEEKEREENLTSIAQSLLSEGATYGDLCEEHAPSDVRKRFVEELKIQAQGV